MVTSKVCSTSIFDGGSAPLLLHVKDYVALQSRDERMVFPWKEKVCLDPDWAERSETERGKGYGEGGGESWIWPSTSTRPRPSDQLLIDLHI